MLAFAANSLLCRLALAPGLIDAASFTSVRMLAGASILALLVFPRWRASGYPQVNWRGVTALFLYMACFSFAYRSLSAGTGALLLFGAVQCSMFVVALARGESFSLLSWVGLCLAGTGLVYLVWPGVAAPDPVGAMLMLLAGVAWGLYSLLGRQQRSPLEASAGNFIAALPLAFGLNALFAAQVHASWAGVALAAASGALASGLGYVVWYAALKGLAATRAATVQLSVPVIAALGGVLLLAEPLTLRLVLSAAASLAGIALVLSSRNIVRPRLTDD
jgi:drug/metabolite transporter (DMT)-like permease